VFTLDVTCLVIDTLLVVTRASAAQKVGDVTAAPSRVLDVRGVVESG
jgi:hypothetical protein